MQYLIGPWLIFGAVPYRVLAYLWCSTLLGSGLSLVQYLIGPWLIFGPVPFRVLPYPWCSTSESRVVLSLVHYLIGSQLSLDGIPYRVLAYPKCYTLQGPGLFIAVTFWDTSSVAKTFTPWIPLKGQQQCTKVRHLAISGSPTVLLW